MGWYRVVKTIKGHRYVYEQRTWREGKRVRTENRYIGPEGGDGRAAGGSPVTTTPRFPAVPTRLIEQTFRELTNHADIPLPPPILAEGRHGKILVEKNAALESLIKGLGPKLGHDARGAYYRPDTDGVNIPPLRMYDDHEGETATQKYYSVVLHELAHWTGRSDRTGRHQRSDPFSGDQGYAREELVAEATATILMRHFDLQSENIDRHVRYFQRYLDDAGDREEALAFALEEARKAADFILGVTTT